MGHSPASSRSILSAGSAASPRPIQPAGLPGSVQRRLFPPQPRREARKPGRDQTQWAIHRPQAGLSFPRAAQRPRGPSSLRGCPAPSNAGSSLHSPAGRLGNREETKPNGPFTGLKPVYPFRGSAAVPRSTQPTGLHSSAQRSLFPPQPRREAGGGPTGGT